MKSKLKVFKMLKLNNLRIITKKRIFLIIFILSSIFVYLVLSYNYKKNVENYLEKKSQQIHLDYKVVYDSFQTLADLIYKTTINQEKVLTLFENRQRDQLQNHLSDEYKKLRKYNLRQLHFHLPGNESFLRMHRPLKFGDDLTNVRSTVAFVNKNKKYIHGFEEGKVFNGFRFVYPLFGKNNNHIGSVEVSFSSLFFIKKLMQNYNILSNILIDKEVVDRKVFLEERSNYIQSPMNGYYFQKSVIDYLKVDHSKIKPRSNFLQNIKSLIDKGDPFSIYIKKLDQVITFIPLVNPVSFKVLGALTVRTSDIYIDNQYKNKMVIFIFILISLAFILVFVYNQLSYQLDLEKEVKEKTKELREFNNTLKEKIDKEIEKNMQKDKLLQEQSKLASMGEMMGSVAHQWRQPLNALNISIQNLDDDFDDGLVDRKFVDKFIERNRRIIMFMSQTIDDFRYFFKIDKEKKLFSIKESIDSVLVIQSAMLENRGIALKIIGDDFKIFGMKSEFQQVILNIINNAKDEFERRDIKSNTKIEIVLKNNLILIKDNAGGIEKDIIHRVFEPYFTTKEQGKGIGMGLYISKMIIEKNMDGRLSVKNDQYGAVFSISFKEKNLV